MLVTHPLSANKKKVNNHRQRSSIRSRSIRAEEGRRSGWASVRAGDVVNEARFLIGVSDAKVVELLVSHQCQRLCDDERPIRSGKVVYEGDDLPGRDDSPTPGRPRVIRQILLEVLLSRSAEDDARFTRTPLQELQFL